jgi:glycosyltransferase involved in cell wall biosynthesis
VKQSVQSKIKKVQIKTAHLTNYYHENSGGVSTSLNNLLAEAERSRRQVRLIVPGERFQIKQVNEYGKIYYVPARRSPVFDRRYRLIMPWQYVLKNSVVRRILSDEKPDIIEVTDKYTLSFIGAMLHRGFFSSLGRPVLVHFSAERMDDNIASYLTGNKVGKLFANLFMANYILPSFDFHIANSQYTAQEFFEAYEKASEFSGWLLKKSHKFFKAPSIPLQERIFVCPRGVDTKFYNPSRKNAEFRKKINQDLGLSETAKLLLYSGRISPEKNIELLPELMKILCADEKDFRLLVAGSGPKRDWLIKQSELFPQRKIILLGHLDKETLANYYANVDVFIHPNPKEPFGNVVLEAMASGIPVVVPNAGGVLTCANSENAWVVEPTPQEFAKAVKTVVEGEELAKLKISKALETVAENSVEKAVSRLFATYDRIYEIFHSRFSAESTRESIDSVKKFAVGCLIGLIGIERCLNWF